MVQINENFLSMEKNYLFSEIASRLSVYKKNNPAKPLIRMGIGDVTLPLAPAVVTAMKKAADEMGVKETFRGYDDSGAGYDFLREAVSGYYKKLGADISPDEIRINDGAKSDCGNITDIFGNDNTILLTDPAYPVYIDSNRIAGRKIIFAHSTEENGFAAMPDSSVHADIIYLCSPNNPTGSVYTAKQLETWVDYALANEAVIIFDSAYEAFITDSTLPRSIYCIRGAEKCAIEMCSLSKTAGFTGVRCGYTVIPEKLTVTSSDGQEIRLCDLWARRQGTKFNGVSYPVQRAAEAVFSDEGQKQIKENIAYYQRNAMLIADTLKELGIPFTGGINSPYIWLRCPDNMSGWEFFDHLLNNIQVVGTPGEGFGINGKGRFRLTAFNSYENTQEAMKRLILFLPRIIDNSRP